MDRYKKITLVLYLILLANIIVAITKISLGYILRISSLTADGFHAISDSASNVVGLIGIKFASKPPDKEHPYGHYKFESVASMIIGFMLFTIAVNIIINAINWFMNPFTPGIDVPSIIALIVTLIINIFIAFIEYKQGKNLNSEVLVSDSIHTRSDILISSGVIITILLIKSGVPPIIDPIFSLVIALFVILSSIKIVKDTFSALTDKYVIDEERIRQIIMNSGMEIIDVHNIRNHGYNDIIFIDLHLVFPENMNVSQTHRIIHLLQDILENKLNRKVELNAHIEPKNR